MHVLRGVFWLLVITAVVTELTSAVGLKLIGRPIYRTSGSYSALIRLPPMTEKDPWGAWAVPDTVSRVVGKCFDVEYRSNSVGARNEETQIKSPRRWIVLGDSMTQGFGIEERDRFTNILEESLGWEFANFATIGDFGPLQYFLLYNDVGKRFEHQGVIVGFLPFNDFTDMVETPQTTVRSNIFKYIWYKW
jgi:hypothetical protein